MKDKRLDIRVSQDDHEKFVEVAEAMGLTVSQAIRFVMLEKRRALGQITEIKTTVKGKKK